MDTCLFVIAPSTTVLIITEQDKNILYTQIKLPTDVRSLPASYKNKYDKSIFILR